MQIVSNRDTLHEMSNPFLCVCVYVCVVPELSFTKYITFLLINKFYVHFKIVLNYL